MKRNIQVMLGKEAFPLGELRYDRQGRRESAAFAYTSNWLAHDERFAIDPSLPMVSGFQFRVRRREGSLFHGSIADTEPDGWGRRVILRDHSKNATWRNHGTAQRRRTFSGNLISSLPLMMKAVSAHCVLNTDQQCR